jgi:hypothetical protein
MNIRISQKWLQFLGTLATAVAAPELGIVPAAVAGYLRLAQQLMALPATSDADVAALTAKVQQLVDEKRGPSQDEIADLEAQISGNSAAIQALRPHDAPIGL